MPHDGDHHHQPPHSHAHGHDHGPNHDHGHDHHGHGLGHHHHGPVRHDAAFAIGVTLNSALVAAQIGFGLAAGSTALLADAVHNLGDVLGLVLAWAASVLVRRAPSARRTYGWGRSTILASLANAMLLLISIGAIGLEAVQRLAHPAPVHAATVAWVAGAGLIVNGATALLFMRGSKGDLNLRSAFTHMASDALLSAGVLVAALIIMRTGWMTLDPLVSLAIVAVIGIGTFGLLRESTNMAMDAVPAGHDPTKNAAYLRTLPNVQEVHDLHVWALSTTETAVTVHLVHNNAALSEDLTCAAIAGLRDQFAIGHATVQVETASVAERCALRSAEVV